MPTASQRKRFLERVAIALNIDTAESAAPDDWAEWRSFCPSVKIRSSGRVIPFEPWDYQIQTIAAIESSQNTIICKSRQLGISELICSWLLWRAVREPGFNAVVFSKTQRDASDLGERIRHMAVSLGDRCPEFSTESQMKLGFKGLGTILFLPVTARAARGIPSVSVLVFDEAAFIDGIDGVYAAAAPTMAMLGDRGRVIFNSTPNGRSGLFYKLWTELNESWTKVKLHYSQHPVYGTDPDWAQKQREGRGYTEAQWRQEFELDFSESDANLFDPELIERAQRGQWEGWQKGDRYWMGVDTATGGSDYWVASVWNVTSKPYRLVAMHRERKKSTDYNLAKTVELIDRYSPQLINVESNAAGQVALESIIRLRPGVRVEGVTTTAQSKRVNTDRLILLLERDEIIFPVDSPLGIELMNFRQSESGRREAANGFNDDTVMSAAIAFAKLDEGHEVENLARKLSALS